MSPLLWSGVPWRNRTAFLDFAGTYELWCRNIAHAIFAVNGKTVRVWPLGTPGGPDWLQTIQAQNVEFANALGIAAPGDLSTYSLDDPVDHASWFFVLSQYSEQVRSAAQLV